MKWNQFSVMALPPDDWVLAYVEFDGPSNPGALPQILRVYYSEHDGYWRTAYGRLRGRVTHWMPLPMPPAVSDPALEAWEEGAERSDGRGLEELPLFQEAMVGG